MPGCQQRSKISHTQIHPSSSPSSHHPKQVRQTTAEPPRRTHRIQGHLSRHTPNPARPHRRACPLRGRYPRLRSQWSWNLCPDVGVYHEGAWGWWMAGRRESVSNRGRKSLHGDCYGKFQNNTGK